MMNHVEIIVLQIRNVTSHARDVVKFRVILIAKYVQVPDLCFEFYKAAVYLGLLLILKKYKWNDLYTTHYKILVMMFRLKVHIIFLIIGLILYSCGDSSTKYGELFPVKINLNPAEAGYDSIMLSEIAEKAEYIPLQTDDSILLEYIYNFKVAGNFIFVENGLDLFRFDTGGRFMNKIFNPGRGPEEALPVCSAIDDENSKVYVYDRNKNVKVYNFDGVFLKKIERPVNPVESQPPWKIEFFDDHLFIATAQKPGVKFIYSLFSLISDSVTPLYINRYAYNPEQQTKRPSIIPYDYCYQFYEKSLIFKEKFCDTIFSLNQHSEVSPKYIISLTDSKLEWETWRDNGMFNIGAGPPEGYWVNSIAESENHLFIVLGSFKRPKIFAVYFKESGNIKMSTIPDFDSKGNQVYLKNDLDHLIDFPAFSKSGYMFYSNDCLYSVIEAGSFKENFISASENRKNSSEYLQKMNTYLESVNEFSNPVIMKVHLK